MPSSIPNLPAVPGEQLVHAAPCRGWDTRYERVRELPASLLYEALHDVLTGWGSRAYEEPVSTLRIPVDPNVRVNTVSAGMPGRPEAAVSADLTGCEV